MHIQHSRTEDAHPYAQVGEPWAGTDGTVYGPEVQSWPLGQGSGLLLVFSLDEARANIATLQAAVAEAEQLFPPQT